MPKTLFIFNSDLKRFIVRSFFFGTLVVLLSFALDVMISFGLRQTDCYRYEIFDEIIRGGMDHDVLIMGNSRGFSHFNTNIIDSICGADSYNIGLGGYPINVQIAEYKCYKKHNALPKVIIQEVSNGTLSWMSDIRYQHDSQRFFPTIYDKTMRKELSKLGYGFWELYCPLYRYFGYQKVIKDGLMEFLSLKHFVDRPTFKGFSPEKGEWDGTEAAMLDSITASFEDVSIVLFEDFLAECKRDGVYVVLVNSPMYEPTTRKLTNYRELNSYFTETANRFGYVFLNYTENYDLCKDSSFFCVSIHLNPQGTAMFSTDFANQINALDLLN